MKTTHIPGKWIAICDVCGLRFYNTELKKDWRDLMVCKDDFELRHPQDFLKVQPDHQNVPWVRPEGTDTFSHDACTVVGLSAIPGLATPGCSIPGRFFTGDFILPAPNVISSIPGIALPGFSIPNSI